MQTLFPYIRSGGNAELRGFLGKYEPATQPKES